MIRFSAWLALAFLAAALIFSLWPEIDLAVSALFRDPETGAWFGQEGVFNLIRLGLWRFGQILMLLAFLLFLVALSLWRQALVPARLWGFWILAMALGPGLIANVLLKEHWGRARPRAITEFGGEAVFTPALQIADQCARNCSFVSGEAAGTAATALVLWLVAFRRAPLRWRPWLAAALIAMPLASGLARIAAGGHFLSDVVFAYLFILAATLALWRLQRIEAAAEQLTLRNLAADFIALWARLRKLVGPRQTVRK